MILVFWKLSFKPTFDSPLSPSSIGSLVPLHVLPLEWYHLHIWSCCYFSSSFAHFSFYFTSPYPPLSSHSSCFPLFSSYEITVRNAMFPAISVYKRCHCPQWLQPSIVSWWALRKHRAEKNTCHLAAIMDSGSWWWTGRPGMLQFMGLQRVGHDWATELNWAAVGQQPLPMLSPEKSQDRKIQDIGTRLLRCISKE